MSTYTIQIRNLVENGYTIFDFDYPIFDEDYRKVLEQKIIDRYYFREIGLETPAQFKHFLKMRMNEIMPYYNQLYESVNVLKELDPLQNVDTTETHTKNIEQTATSNQEGLSTQSGESSGSNTSTNTGKQVFQDTPQSRLGDLNYATNINDTSDNGSVTSTNQASNTTNNTNESQSQGHTMETYETKQLGSYGMRYPAEVIMEWRKAFLNIDVQILDNLNDLFMGVY